MNQNLSTVFQEVGVNDIYTLNVRGPMEEVFIGTQEHFSKVMDPFLDYGVYEPKVLDFVWDYGDNKHGYVP